MDSRTTYQSVVERVIREYAAMPYGDLQREVVIDTEANRYIIFTMGWQGYRRIHSCVIHLDIIDNKVWVQEDNTENGITYALLEAGIAKQHIVLGFQHPTVRELTEFAVA